MRNKTKVIATIFLAFILFFACKKTTTPPPEDNTPAPSAVPLIAKVNGADWTVVKSGLSYSTYTTIFGDTLSVGGSSAFNPPNSRIGLVIKQATGVVNLTKNGPYQAYYQDTANVGYSAISGTMNIAQMVSGSGKLHGTFSFVTESVSGKSYTITGGVINFL